MNFARVIDLVARYLEQHDVPYFLVGGLAMHAYGSSRLTSDVDLLTWNGIREGAVKFMEQAGYETLHSASGFSNHLHPDQEWGRIDFIYSSRETIEKIGSSTTQSFAVGEREIAIPRPEHLVAMKILAMKNEPRRTLGEMSDIQHLMSLPETDLDQVREYFQTYGLLERYHEIRELSV